MEEDDAPPRGCNAISLWAGDHMLVWLGEAEGYRYRPAHDAWSSIATASAPRGRARNAAWTGREMITANTIDFTNRPDERRADAYDPATDRWRSLAEPPFNVGGHAFTWTGAHGLLWSFDEAALYDPCEDRWTVLQASPPMRLAEHRWLWTETEVIVWGVAPDGLTIAALALNPYTDTWRVEDRIDRWVAAVWTGEEVLVPVHH